MKIEDLPPSPLGYQLLDEIHQSASSFVYRAKRLVDLEAVIVKLLKPQTGDSNSARFQNGLVAYARQYALAKSLNSIYAVRPLSLEKYGDGLILVLPDEGYVSLKEYQVNSCSDIQDFLDIALKIIDLVLDLHQKRIFHRQINQDHLLVHPETKQVKITDFSLAVDLVFVPQDYAQDLSDLGKTLYELLTNKTFISVKDCQHNLDDQKEIDHIILKLIAEEEDDKYQDAISLKSAISQCNHQILVENNSNNSQLINQKEKKRLAQDRQQTVISSDFFKLVIDSIPQAIFWKDRNSVYLGCNQIFADDAGLQLADIIGKSDYDLPWTKKEADFYRECDRRVMESDTAEYHIIETQFQRDGKLSWLNTNKIPLHNSAGNVIGILGTYEDITKQKKIESEIRHKEEKFRFLVSNVHGVVYRCLNDSNRTMEFMSDAIEKISGYRATDFIDNRMRTYSSIIHPEDIRQVEISMAEALTKKETFAIEYRILHRQNNEIRWIYEKGQGIFDQDNQLLHLEGVVFDISDRKLAEEKLHNSLKELTDFKYALDRSSIVAITDAQGKIVYANDNFCDISQYSRAELIGNTHRLINSGYHSQKFFKNLWNTISNGNIWQGEIFNRAKDNSCYWVNTTIVPFLDAKNKPFQYLAIREDISDLKRTEIILNNQLEKTKLLSKITQEIQYSLDPKQIFKTTTKEIRKYLGADRVIIFSFDKLSWYQGQIMAEDVLSFCPSVIDSKIDISTFIKDFVDDFSLGKILIFFEQKVKVLNPNYLEFLERFNIRSDLVIPLLKDSGLWGILCIHQCSRVRHWQKSEIKFIQKIAVQLNLALYQAELLEEAEKQKQKQIESAERERILNRAIKRIHQSFNLENIYRAINESFIEIKQFFNCDYLEVYQFEPDREGKFVFPNVISGLAKFTTNNLENRLTTNNLDALEAIKQFRARTDITIPVLIDQRFWGIIIVVSDFRQKRWKLGEISFFEEIGDRLGIALQQAELLEKLRQSKLKADSANKAKSKFLANMSHELRTPLNAILGFSQLMQKDQCLNSQQQKTLNIINTSGEHLLELINNVLEMSKIEADKTSLSCHSFDLYQLLNSLEKMLLLKARSKRLDLKINCWSTVPRYINTDQNKLRQVLINLLTNSIKFTKTGSIILEINTLEAKISLSNLSSEEKIIEFKIIDTGIGIDRKNLDLLFNPFYQSESGFNAEPGTGLGLSISRQFIKLMGGDITIESELGQGTTVKFDIKVNSSQIVESSEELETHIIGIAPHSPKYRILIVEDKWESRELLVQLLESIGFIVRVAVNGQKAVELWQQWLPELILMDMQMPVMNGYEAIAKIREEEVKISSNNCTIIALTASVFNEERDPILAVGADDIVNKPFKELVLLNKIKKFLELDFIYQEVIPSSDNLLPTKILSDREILDILQTIPSDWVSQLHWAAIRLDEEKAFDLIAEIEERSQFLANILNNWVDQLKFDAIIEYTSQIINT